MSYASPVSPSSLVNFFIPEMLRSSIMVLISFVACRVDGSAYPGTAIERNEVVKENAKNLTDLNGPWDEVRKKLLSACGLWDNQHTDPGQGNTGHCFADYNHVDCCTMQEEIAHDENRGRVRGRRHEHSC